MDQDNLAQRVQDLPPELYNMILHEVFSTATTTHYIDTHWRPSKLLSISKATWKMYAESYYGSGESSFVFQIYPGPGFDRIRRLVSWLQLIPASHRSMLQGLTLTSFHKWYKPSVVRKRVPELRESMVRTLAGAGLIDTTEVLMLKLYVMGEDGVYFVYNG